MLEIGNTVVSFDLFTEQFCCDLGTCKGDCCVQGDSGAPLDMDEIAEIENVLPVIWDDLSEAAQKTIDEQGVASIDPDGELVTSLVNGRECVFSYIDPKDGICKCAIEKAYREGKTDYIKPMSCHLYPARIKQRGEYIGVNFHRWAICDAAEVLGKKLKLPVYVFLKEPLIRRFGEDWYKELTIAAKEFYRQFGYNNKEIE